MIKFLGQGGAFETKTNSSFYLVSNNSILFGDMGENVFQEAKKIIDCNEYNNINVVITHTHSDHVGSIGTFVFYCYYIKKRKTNILVNSLEDKLQIKLLLNLFGLTEGKEYEFIFQLENYMKISLKKIKTTHVEELLCYGLLIKKDDEQIYYSGDSNSIPLEIIEKLKKGEITKFYQDVTLLDYEGNVHYNFDKFIQDFPEESLDKTKVYFYHNDIFDVTKEINIADLKIKKNQVIEINEKNIDIFKKREINIKKEKEKFIIEGKEYNLNQKVIITFNNKLIKI